MWTLLTWFSYWLAHAFNGAATGAHPMKYRFDVVDKEHDID